MSSVVKALTDASLWWSECQELCVWSDSFYGGNFNIYSYREAWETKYNAEEELFEAVKGYSKVFIE